MGGGTASFSGIYVWANPQGALRKLGSNCENSSSASVFYDSDDFLQNGSRTRAYKVRFTHPKTAQQEEDVFRTSLYEIRLITDVNEHCTVGFAFFESSVNALTSITSQVAFAKLSQPDHSNFVWAPTLLMVHFVLHISPETHGESYFI
jgi:hypothetical protein